MLLQRISEASSAARGLSHTVYTYLVFIYVIHVLTYFLYYGSENFICEYLQKKSMSKFFDRGFKIVPSDQALEKRFAFPLPAPKVSDYRFPIPLPGMLFDLQPMRVKNGSTGGKQKPEAILMSNHFKLFWCQTVRSKHYIYIRG